MRRQPGPHSGYSPGRPGAEGPAKLSLDCWCTEPGIKGMRITKSAVVCRKQAQPPLLRVHHFEIAPELRCLASQVSLLCRRPSSSELQRGGQKAFLSVTSYQELSPLGESCRPGGETGTSHSVQPGLPLHLRITDSISGRTFKFQVQSSAFTPEAQSGSWKSCRWNPSLLTPTWELSALSEDLLSQAGTISPMDHNHFKEDEMVRRHHPLKGHEFEQTVGDNGGRRRLACCSPWGRKELDRT